MTDSIYLMDEDEINNILQDHALWLKDCNEGKRADLSGDVMLSLSDLREALLFAELQWSDLESVILDEEKPNEQR